MPVVEIICLANSRKHSGRCVAGLRTDGQGWIRPISSYNKGELISRHYTLNNGKQADVMDILRIDIASPRPSPHQPENWLIGNQPWQLLAGLVFPSFLPLLQSQVILGSTLFGNQSDRIPFNSFSQVPAQASLALVIPKNLEWQITTSFSGQRQTRAIFTLGGVRYNLVVTDPVWENILGDLPFGSHPLTAVDDLDPDHEIWLTISLGEPFDGYCYKLVAAVLKLPRY